jgi:ribonuclease BN (tRNA processing enzyme)
MRVTFLGTGSAMATPGRAQTGLLLADGDRRLLVDCGSGILGNLSEYADYEAVDALLVTHHHTDHVADLIPLLKARWLAGDDPLTIAGPPGTRALVEDSLDVHDYLQGRVEYAVTEVGPGTFSLAGFDVAARETRHSMRCFAYRFDGAFGFSGDTEADPELAAFFEGCRAVAHDCSFPDGVDVSNHPTPSALGDALADYDLGTVYLTHLYPHTEGRHREILDSVERHYDGEVRFARDGLTVDIGGGEDETD